MTVKREGNYLLENITLDGNKATNRTGIEEIWWGVVDWMLVQDRD
jgi:hypothetical protein